MSDQPAYAAELPVASYDYDAFLSYSRADTPVAEGIQKGLHRIGRKMGRLHALRVFRDKTDLAASPSLWAKITDALDKSRYLVVVLSPNSADSEWVNKEIDYWLAHRGRDNLVLVLADGTVVWDESHGRFDPGSSTAAPPALAAHDALTTEPIYIDVSEDNPWDANNPAFRDKITDIAAPIHGKPKYELASEDLREQQRFRRFRRLAFTAVALLAVVAVVAATLAFTQRREALHQRNDALARSLVADGEAILKEVRGGGDDRALQELISAYRIAPTTARGGLLTGLQATATTEKIIRTGGIPTDVLVTPDGKRIITGGGDEAFVRIWDAVTGAQLSEFPGLPGTAVFDAIALSPDGMRLLSLDSDATVGTGDVNSDVTVGLWNVETGELTGRFTTSPGWSAVRAAMSADGTRVVAAGTRQPPNGLSAQEVQVWGVDSGVQIGTLRGEASTSTTDEAPAPFTALAVSPGGHRVVAADQDENIRIWDADTGEQIAETRTSDGPRLDRRRRWATALKFSPDGSRFVAGVTDGSVQVRDATTGELVIAPMTSHAEIVYAVAYSPDGDRIASGGSGDNAVHVWDAATGDPIGAPLAGHLEPVQGVAFTPDGERIVSTSLDRTIRVWRGDADNRLGAPPEAPAGDLPAGTRVIGLAPGSDLRFLISSLWRVALWNLEGNRTTKLTPVDPDLPLHAFAMTPDGRRAAVLNFKEMQVWDLHTGEMVSRATDDAESSPIAISPDGTRVATSAANSDEGTSPLNIFDANTGDRIDIELGGIESNTRLGISALRFSPDNKQLAVGTSKGEVRVWNTETGQPVGDVLPTDINAIYAITYSLDGRLLAASGGKSIWVWDAHTLDPVGVPLVGHTKSIHALDFSPDGQFLASGDNSENGEVRIWDVSKWQQVSEPLVGGDSPAANVGFSADGSGIFAGGGESAWRWPGPAMWPDLLCNKLSANMSRAQWRMWVSPDIDYIAACPELPIPE